MSESGTTDYESPRLPASESILRWKASACVDNDKGRKGRTLQLGILAGPPRLNVYHICAFEVRVRGRSCEELGRPGVGFIYLSVCCETCQPPHLDSNQRRHCGSKNKNRTEEDDNRWLIIGPVIGVIAVPADGRSFGVRHRRKRRQRRVTGVPQSGLTVWIWVNRKAYCQWLHSTHWISSYGSINDSCIPPQRQETR